MTIFKNNLLQICTHHQEQWVKQDPLQFCGIFSTFSFIFLIFIFNSHALLAWVFYLMVLKAHNSPDRTVFGTNHTCNIFVYRTWAFFFYSDSQCYYQLFTDKLAPRLTEYQMHMTWVDFSLTVTVAKVNSLFLLLATMPYTLYVFLVFRKKILFYYHNFSRVFCFVMLHHLHLQFLSWVLLWPPTGKTKA